MTHEAKVNDLVFYMPADGPYKGKLCPAVVTEVIGPLVNLEVRTAEADFVENVANVPLVNRRPKKGECCLRSQLQ